MATKRLNKIMVIYFAVSIGLFSVACGKKNNKSVNRTGGPVTTAPESDTTSRTLTVPGTGEQTADSDVPTENEDTPPQTVQPRRVQMTLLEERALSPEEQTRLSQPIPERSDADMHGLVYTGSAEDTFVFELKAKLAAVTDEATKARDLEFAKQVGLTQVHHNVAKKQVTITTLIEREGKREHYNLIGNMSETFTSLAGSASQSPFITAELKCMDRNNGCNNMIIKMVDHKVPAAKRTAFVVVRSGPAWQHIIHTAPHMVKNKEYQRLVTILTNTRQRWLGERTTAINTVTDILLNTSETVNGSATFVAGMQLAVGGYNPYNYECQKITWAGPLVSTENNAQFDVSASVDYLPRNYSAAKVNIDRELPYLTDFIKSTRLVSNDGKGKIGLAITIRANLPGEQEETFMLELTRQSRPVHYLGL